MDSPRQSPHDPALGYPTVDALLKDLQAAADAAQKNLFLTAPAREAIAGVAVLLAYLVRHVRTLEQRSAPDGKTEGTDRHL